MYWDFDLHAASGRAVLLRESWRRPSWTEIWDLNRGEQIGKIDVPVQQAPRLSPDGKTVALFGEEHITLYNIDSGAVTTRAAGLGDNTSFCEWSPNGRRIAFTSRPEGGPPNVFILDVKSNDPPFQLTAGPEVGRDRFPQWSPCGRYIVFLRQILDEPGVPRWVYVANVQTGASFALAQSCQPGRFCWSSDSAHIAVSQAHGLRSHLSVIRLRDRKTVWSRECGGECFPAFSPDGQRILAVSSENLLEFSFPEGKRLEQMSLSEMGAVLRTHTGPCIDFGSDARTVYFLAWEGLYCWTPGSECTQVLREPMDDKPLFKAERHIVPSSVGGSVALDRFTPPDPKSAVIMSIQWGPPPTVAPDSFAEGKGPGKPDSLGLHLIEQGYELLEVHYRPVDGQYGVADLRDILECALYWKQRDNRPLMLVGNCYGGFLAMLALMLENAPWECGVVTSPVVDMSDIPHHVHKAFPSDPEAKAAAMKELSPREQAERIRLPLLILHDCEREDIRSIHERVTAKHVPCELIVYADDVHGLPVHRKQVTAEIEHFAETHCR